MSCGGDGQHEAILYRGGDCVNVRTGARYVSVAHPDGTIDFDTYTVVHPPESAWCDEAVAGYSIARSA